MNRYYTQPIQFAKLMKGEEHPVCTLQQSIAQRIHLMLISNLNECRSDRNFGFEVWERDFENVHNLNKWKDDTARIVKVLIEKYEARIQQVKATVEFAEEEFMTKGKDVYRKIKRRVDIKISASIKKTNEPFYFRELLYISPVWID